MEATTDRQLSAIMFTDIVGYTALMQSNEKEAAQLRARHRRVFEEQHKLFNGRIVQYYGDGTLSVFNSAIKACECATQIQLLLRKGDPLPLRIGLHLGDIVFDKTEVYGDGVNVTARIESLAVEGSILLSSNINEELKNQESISTISLGSFDFKNVADPMEIFAIDNEGLELPKGDQLMGKISTPQKSLAVLPFVNMSSNADNEYFSDGMTEEIINALSKIESLKVTSRTSSFYFKNKSLPIKKIAKELNVSAILEGSVRVAGKALRITAQLIEAEGDYHFWSETWDRELENIFETQDEISLLIADKLREQYGHFEIQEHLVDKQTKLLTAYDLVLKARFLLNKWNPLDINKAIVHLEEAVALDPEYAEAYADLADCYSFLGTTGFLPYAEAWQKSHNYTIQAQKLDKNLPSVFYQLSNEAFFIEANYQGSLDLMKKALVVDPNNAKAHEFLSFLYIIAGDRKKSREHLDNALQINPMSEETKFFNGYFHYMIGDLEKANGIIDKCIEANDKNIPAHSIKSFILLIQKKFDEAMVYFESIPQEIVIPEERSGVKLLAYALKKDKAQTAVFLKEVEEQTKGHNKITADSFVLFYHVLLGEVDQAFDWINSAMKTGSFTVLLRFADPIIRSLRGDPRYEELGKKIFHHDGTDASTSQKKPLLDPSVADQLVEELESHIQHAQPYLNSDLTLRSLADQINIQANQLSWLINTKIGKNFNDYINHFRNETFKSLVKKPENSEITIMGLAYDSGYNSTQVSKRNGANAKAVYERFGITPRSELVRIYNSELLSPFVHSSLHHNQFKKHCYGNDECGNTAKIWRT